MELSTLVLLVMACGLRVGADGTNHRYKEGDHVPLYANKVGPFHNPSETYRYYDLPFCSPEHVTQKTEALGEVLNGDRLEQQSKSLCKKNLSKEDVAKFRHAVSKDYYFEMYYDDLPLWGFLGKIEGVKTDSGKDKYFLFKHIHFNILYNDDRVIEINVQTDPNINVDISEDRKLDVEFLYSVKWKNTDISFEERMAKYSRTSSMPQHLEIHWFSIVNSCVTVLLTGFLATIQVLFQFIFQELLIFLSTSRKIKSTNSEDIAALLSFKFARLNEKIIKSVLQLIIFRTLWQSNNCTLINFYWNLRKNALDGRKLVLRKTCNCYGYSAIQNQLLSGNFRLRFRFSIVNSCVNVLLLTGFLATILMRVLKNDFIFLTSPLLILGRVAGKSSITEFQAPCHTNKHPREIPDLARYQGTNLRWQWQDSFLLVPSM
ncbi:unnamed protein product [Musa hybrid cultivar]